MAKKTNRKFYLLLILLISILGCGCATKSSGKEIKVNKDVLTEKQWVEDIEYLHSKLPQKHKNLYHSLKKEEFDKKISDLEKDVPKLKGEQIQCKLSQIVASIGDAHTSLDLEFGQGNIQYPMFFNWFEKDLRVMATEKEYKEILGKKVIAINNIPIDEIVGKINSLISHENEQWLKVINADYVSMPQILKLLNVTWEDTAEFTFEDDKGELQKLKFTPKDINKNSVIKAKDFIENKPVNLQYDEKDLNSKLYWYKYIPEDKILYFQYNQCIDRNTAKQAGGEGYKSLPDFEKFSKGLINEINNKEVGKLVIDLRRNTGGNSSLMTELVNKFKSIEKLKNKGKIFVMTSKVTFSSGVFACIDFKENTDAIFYGEPTGGNVNGYGDIKILTLPNSKMEVSYSTKYFNLSDKYKTNFIPDVIINQRFDHYIKGIDDVYEAIRLK